MVMGASDDVERLRRPNTRGVLRCYFAIATGWVRVLKKAHPVIKLRTQLLPAQNF